MSITANIHRTERMEAVQTDKGYSWVELIADTGRCACVHTTSYEVALATANAFNAAMEAERKPVAAE